MKSSQVEIGSNIAQMLKITQLASKKSYMAIICMWKVDQKFNQVKLGVASNIAQNHSSST